MVGKLSSFFSPPLSLFEKKNWAEMFLPGKIFLKQMIAGEKNFPPPFSDWMKNRRRTSLLSESIPGTAFNVAVAQSVERP